MKRKSVLILGLVAALALSLALCGCAKKYEPETKTQSLDNSTLITAGTLTVGINGSNAPLAASSGNTYVGIDVDIAAAIADELGLKLSLVNIGTDTASALKNNKCDIVMGVSAAGDGYVVSSAYRKGAAALFAINSSTEVPSSGSTTSVAAASASQSAKAVSSVFGSDSLTEVSDVKTAFEDLEKGTTKFAAADSVVGAYTAHANGITATPVALLSSVTSYGVACSSTKTAVKTSVGNVVNTLSTNGMIDVIMKKWLGTSVDLSKLPVLEATDTSSTDTSSSVVIDTNTKSTTSTSSSTSSSSTSNSSNSSSKKSSN